MKTIQEHVAELPTIKCKTCGGAGFTAEHSVHGHTDDGECTQCPAQVQCYDCHAEGVYTTLDEVAKLLTDIEAECAKEKEDALTSQKNEIREKIRGIKKYHKEFECNGAHNGKGCYEDFCEDQNCRNAPKEYNQALDDVLALLDNN